ncbi:MAG TPA: hypothetical protein VF495_03760 [Phenylobacterium sp.]
MRLSRFLKSALAFAAVAAMALAPGLSFAAAGVTADVRARIAGTYTGTPTLGNSVFNFNENVSNAFVPGTGPGQVDKMYAGTRTLSASSSENLDLAGGLSDPFGVTLTCVKVRFIYVHALATNTNDVQVGGAASNGFLGPFADLTDIVVVKPGGQFLATAPAGGWTVTASTGDLLKVANSSSGTGVTYDVIVGCTSA